MRKVIAAINLTLDGLFDHTLIIAPAEEIHQHYADLLKSSDTVLYGRITYQLMEYWRTVVENPTGNKSTDEFAKAIDNITKIVFSRTLKKVDWESAKLANRDLKEEILALKQQLGKDILVCSPSLLVALTQLDLIDEYQFFIHPVIAGSGSPLFKDLNHRAALKLLKTKSFNSGGIILYYAHSNENVMNS